MRKWKCIYTTNTNKYTFTVGKIYESDDNGYGIKGDDGFIFDVTTASQPTGTGRGFAVTKFEEVFEEEIMKQYREVDREPVVGDMVKIIKMSNFIPETNGVPDYKIGDIIKIIKSEIIMPENWYRYSKELSSNNVTKVLLRDEFVVVEEIKQFNKSDLQECDIVVLRNGERYVLFNNRLVSDIRSSISIKQYSNNLRINEFDIDIMQVYRNNQLIFSRVEPTERELQIKQLQDEMDKIKVKLEELR